MTAEAPDTDTGIAETPEAAERLARAVAAAEHALIEYEIAVETFRIEVANFSRLHDERLGPLHARLEEVEARIAEAVAARTGDPEDLRRAQQARARLTPLPHIAAFPSQAPGGAGGAATGGAAGDAGWEGQAAPGQPAPGHAAGQAGEDGPTHQPEPPRKVRPSPEARKLYRDLVRVAHPDLATDEEERARRDAFISRVNEAYARGDADALRDLTVEWEETGGVPRPPDVAELAARLEWLARRKEWLEGEVAALETSAIGSLLRLAPDTPDGPDQLLDSIAADLERKVAAREAELASLLR